MNPETHILPPLPASWSALTWQQLCDVWTAKMLYGGNPDVAACAALLALAFGDGVKVNGSSFDGQTGESTYTIEATGGRRFTTTPRQLAHMAKQSLPWLQFPYGDPGKEAVKDEKGKVIEESVPPHRGYVNPNWRDAMALPETEVVVGGGRIIPVSSFKFFDERSGRAERQVSSNDGTARPETLNLEPETSGFIHFALPEVACNNLTWHQYRSLQALAPMLFQEGQSDDDTLRLQAQFLAAMLVPEEMGGATADRFRKTHRFRYDADRAEQSQQFWTDMLLSSDRQSAQSAAVLFHICFQVWQTAMHYYSEVFPLLFHGDGKQDPLRDALTGEVGPINSVMKYQGYSDPQQVYDANLPIILDTLNTMTKEAKEIEKMNSKIKRK